MAQDPSTQDLSRTIIEVCPGLNPPLVAIHITNREALVIYDPNQTLHLIIDLMDAFKKAWPNHA